MFRKLYNDRIKKTFSGWILENGVLYYKLSEILGLYTVSIHGYNQKIYTDSIIKIDSDYYFTQTSGDGLITLKLIEPKFTTDIIDCFVSMTEKPLKDIEVIDIFNEFSVTYSNGIFKFLDRDVSQYFNNIDRLYISKHELRLYIIRNNATKVLIHEKNIMDKKDIYREKLIDIISKDFEVSNSYIMQYRNEIQLIIEFNIPVIAGIRFTVVNKEDIKKYIKNILSENNINDLYFKYCTIDNVTNNVRIYL